MKYFFILGVVCSLIASAMEKGEQLNCFEIIPVEIQEHIVNMIKEGSSFRALLVVDKYLHSIAKDQLLPIIPKYTTIIQWCKKQDIKVAQKHALIDLLYAHMSSPTDETLVNKFVRHITNAHKRPLVMAIVARALELGNYNPLKLLIKKSDNPTKLFEKLIKPEVFGADELSKNNFKIDDFYYPFDDFQGRHTPMSKEFSGKLPSKLQCADVCSFIKILLEHELDANSYIDEMHYKRPLFHFACSRGNLELVKKFITNGICADIRDYYYWNALHFMAYDSFDIQSLEEKKEIVNELCAQGININAYCCGEKWLTPLDIAYDMITLNRAAPYQKEFIEHLKKCGAKTCQETQEQF